MKEVSQTSVPLGGPYTLRQLGPVPCRDPQEFMATRSLLLGHWLVLDDVYIVAACPTREGAEAARRLLSGEAVASHQGGA